MECRHCPSRVSRCLLVFEFQGRYGSPTSSFLFVRLCRTATHSSCRDPLDALAAQLSPPTAHDIRRALQTLGRAGAPAELLEALEAWSADQSRQVA